MALAPNCCFTLPHRKSFPAESSGTCLHEISQVLYSRAALLNPVPQCHRPRSMVPLGWGQGLHTITELDCKEQFNFVQPTDVQDHVVRASAWLRSKRRWRMSEVVLSVHHMHSTLDRAGKASAYGFRYITHGQLCSIVQHELSKSNACWAAGNVWVRTNCIPMGGPFSAQGADVHSLWQLYQHRHLLRSLGSLTVSLQGFPLWEGRWGRVAMCQFRDNILLATDCPVANHAALVEHIRHVLKTAWNVEVECDCIGPRQKQCTGNCCAPVRKAVGVVMAVQPPGEGCAFVEPAALKPDWSLRMQAPPLLGVPRVPRKHHD